MRLTRSQLKNLIRSNLLSESVESRITHKSLLLEEIYGAQAIVYHGTKADPIALIDALLEDKFRAGEGDGEMYGKGLYTVYHLEGTRTGTGYYGDHVIKLKVNLYGYIIFDPFVASTVYGEMLTPAEQAEEVGYSDDVVKALRWVAFRQPESRFTSDTADAVHKSLQHEVKGLVFTGRNDGRVVVVYDPTTAVPMAWKRVALDKKPVSGSWTPVDRSKLLAPLERPDVSARVGRPVQQSALGRSALGDFEAGKWEPLTLLKRLERLPEDLRVVNGNLDLMGTPITSLPAGLKVGGSLNLYGTPITSLPTGLQVRGELILSYSRIASISEDLHVGGDLSLYGTPITELPSGLRVGGYLDLRDTSITSLPEDLQVGGSLDLNGTDIASLPAGLRVGGDLDISDTSVASLPPDLRVGGGLYLAETSIASLPPGLKVGGSIYGLDREYWEDVPEHLKGKLQ